MAARKNKAQPWGFYLPNLEAWRRYRVLTQLELAARSDVSNEFFSKLESGMKRTAPETIGRIADALGLTREQLVRATLPTAA